MTSSISIYILDIIEKYRPFRLPQGDHMRRIFNLLTMFCLALVISSCGGGGGGGAVNETFTISYNPNGAESGIVPASQHGDEETAQAIQSNTGNLAKSGYLFDGWNTAANGSGTNFAPGTSYKGKNITLYAKWAAIYNYEIISLGSPAQALDGQQRAIGVSCIRIINLTARGKTLASIIIPEAIDGYRVVAIGAGAFQNCDAVTELSIPNTVTSIGDNAFTGCTGISTLTIPSGVTSIGSGTFSGCAGLNSIVLLTATPPALGTGALEGCTAIVSVPVEGVDDYKAAGGWNTYSASIAGYSTEIYTVTFDCQGATTLPSFTSKDVLPPAVAVGQLPTAPTKTGYNFGGWYTLPEGAGTEFAGNTVVSSNMTIFAKWEEYNYTVTFDGDEATVDPVPTSKIVSSPNTKVDSLPTAPKKDGFYFCGWFTGQNGEGTEFTANTVVTGNITVYAKWITGYNVSINPLDNGNIVANPQNDLSPGTTVTLTVTPESGYELEEINVKDSNNNAISITPVVVGTTYRFTIPNKNVVVSALFRKITYNINGTGSQARGNVSFTGTPQVGESITLNITPQGGYKLDTLTVTKASGGNVPIDTIQEGCKYTFTMPADSVNITAVFDSFIPVYANLNDLEVGDVVLQNGKYVSYSSFITATASYLAISPAAGVVAYKGNSGSYGITGKTYMVSLMGNNPGTAWASAYVYDRISSQLTWNNGSYNTASVASECASDNYLNFLDFNAIYFAYNYSVPNYTTGWFLPALNELHQLYNNKEAINNSLIAIGKGALWGKYWSSNRGANSTAYYLDFETGNETYAGTSQRCFSRPVRALEE